MVILSELQAVMICLHRMRWKSLVNANLQISNQFSKCETVMRTTVLMMLWQLQEHTCSSLFFYHSHILHLLIIQCLTGCFAHTVMKLGAPQFDTNTMCF